MSKAKPTRDESAQPERRRWIWYRDDPEGGVALQEMRKLDRDGQARLAVVIERYQASQSRRKDVDHLGDGLFELRTRVGNNHFRVIFCRWGPHLLALTCFAKNQQKTPKQDIDRAKTRRSDWQRSFGKGP